MHAREPDWRIGGRFATLPEGRTFWRRDGSIDGVPIVLVHGATVPSWEFDALVPPLLRAGFSPVRFDLYGHGASDRPAGPYEFERFTRQALELLRRLDLDRPPILLGHSFGAAVVAAIVASNPGLAARVVLVAPMLDFTSTSAFARLVRVPMLGEIAMRTFGMPGLVRRRRRRYEAIGRPHFTARFLEQARDPAFGRAVVSMFRHGALGDRSACYRGLRESGRDVLLLTGDRDAIIPAAHVAGVRELLGPHRHAAFDAEHNLLLTHPQPVADALVRWLDDLDRGDRVPRAAHEAPTA